MAELPPSPFSDPGALDLAPGDAAVSVASQALADTAADIQETPAGGAERGVRLPETEEGRSIRLGSTDCIAEIFVGARKLFDPDPAAYTNTDQVLYDLLCQLDKPETPDLVSLPDEASFMIELGPPPLFLRMAG